MKNKISKNILKKIIQVYISPFSDPELKTNNKLVDFLNTDAQYLESETYKQIENLPASRKYVPYDVQVNTKNAVPLLEKEDALFLRSNQSIINYVSPNETTFLPILICPFLKYINKNFLLAFFPIRMCHRNEPIKQEPVLCGFFASSQNFFDKEYENQKPNVHPQEIVINKKKHQFNMIEIPAIGFIQQDFYFGIEVCKGYGIKNVNGYGVRVLDYRYMLAELQITQDFYEQVMGEMPKINQAYVGKKKPMTMGDIDWDLDDIKKFCNRLSELQDLEPYYSNFYNKKGNGYRLPSYLEWALAASDGKTIKTEISKEGRSENNLCHGFSDPKECEPYIVNRANLPKVGSWSATKIRQAFHTVSKDRKPSAWGFYDMFGNLFEICHQHQTQRSTIMKYLEYVLFTSTDPKVAEQKIHTDFYTFTIVPEEDIYTQMYGKKGGDFDADIRDLTLTHNYNNRGTNSTRYCTIRLARTIK